MSGGRERGVAVWEAHETLLLHRLSAVDEELRSLAEIEEPPTRARVERVGELETERQRLQLMLAQLGPSPRAKMG